MLSNNTSCVPDFFEIHIENTNSCGYKCIMCPRDKHTRKIGFMSVEDFSLVLDRIENFHGDFHLHGFGEPLLDRQLPIKIERLKKKFPRSQAQIFSTLGVNAQRDYFEKIVDSGLDHIMVSLYGFTSESYQQVHGFDGFDRMQRNLELLSRLVKEKKSSLIIQAKVPGKGIYSALPVSEPEERSSFIQWIKDLGCHVSEWPEVHNYAGGRDYNAPDSQKMCPVINGKRKNILNIAWNLDVIPCSFDFNGTMPFGNLRDSSLEEIFSSQAYFNFILAHNMNELSSYSVCQNCEKRDYR